MNHGKHDRHSVCTRPLQLQRATPLGGFLALGVLLAGFALAPAMRAATVQIGSTNAVSGQPVTVPLSIFSGTTPLGGYSLDVNYDTNVLRIADVLGGANEFAGLPTFNTNTLGKVTLLGQNLGSLTSPTGLAIVAQFSFTSIGAPGSSATVQPVNILLFDTDGNTNTLPVNAITNGTITVLTVPVAIFSASPTNGLAPLLVTFTDSSTGVITNRSWNFGDGSTTNTTATSLAHTYQNAGTNTVTLTVSGPAGSGSNTRTNYIIATNLPPQLVVSPATRDYGTLIVGQTSNQNFSVINAGQQSLTGLVTVSSPFAIGSGSPFNVAAGQTGTVTVSFGPLVVGNFTNSVVFSSNGGSSTNAVTGRALTAPQLGVAPSSLNFGTIATGTTAQLTFVVTNSGGATLTGTATGLSAPFAVISGGSYTVAGFGSTNVVVSFTPTSAASFSNSVIFASNGGASTNAVLGSGAILPVAAFSGTPTNGIAPFTVTFTDTSSGTITNRNWSFGDGVTLNTNATIVAHTYTIAGSNTVRLIVSGPVGVSTNTKTAYIVSVVYPPGDVNADLHVTGADSLLINQALVSLRATNDAAFATAGFQNGDVNQDGQVTGADSLLMNQVLVSLRAYVVTKVLPALRTNTVPTSVTIYGVGFPTNGVTGVTIGAPVNLTLSNVVVVSREQITALVPAGGGTGTGTVNVAATGTNGVVSFGRFINQ